MRKPLNTLVTAFLASAAACAFSRAQPYKATTSPNGCLSRQPKDKVVKDKAKKKMAQASRRRNRK